MRDRIQVSDQEDTLEERNVHCWRENVPAHKERGCCMTWFGLQILDQRIYLLTIIHAEKLYDEKMTEGVKPMASISADDLTCWCRDKW